MWLVFLHGPPGSGKLTVGRELQSITGFRLFHNHLVVDLLESLFEFEWLRESQIRTSNDAADRHGSWSVMLRNKADE